MHNAYCDADENSLDLRIHLKRHTTCAKSAEKDLGVTVTGPLSWHSYIYTITTWDNRLLGLLKRTCPLLTDVSTRRAPYLSLVKSQLCCATQVWSPAQVSLKAQVERVQRRATKWILQTRIGEMSCITDLLPWTYSLLPTTENWKTWYSFISAYLIIFTLMYAFASIPAIWINNFFNNFIWFIT